MIRSIRSLYSPRFPRAIIYMLQNSDYHPLTYLAWVWRTHDFSTVEYRRSLERTKAARLLLIIMWFGMIVQILVAICLLWLWLHTHVPGCWEFGFALLLGYPVFWAHLIVIPLLAGRFVIINPRNARRTRVAEQVFASHPGQKIAITGSYGKTSMKELLVSVLGEHMHIAATPANKNVMISHANFAHTLTGKEDILLIEYGEGAPGDVARFAKLTHPNRAIITGVAAAHLDQYQSTAAAGRDIFTVAEFITDTAHVYVNGESHAALEQPHEQYPLYDHSGALGWQVHDVTVRIDGLSCTLSKGTKTLRIETKLIGRHQIGPLALAAGLAHEFGMSNEEVRQGIARIRPFEHRMQPYQLNGAWIIDDTYNGNIEGIRAGTALLRELPAQRKLYVTPGLVDQGAENKLVHEEMGRLIANSGADVVVLMNNSVNSYIQTGLHESNYQGEIIIEHDPLMFYMNLSQFVAAGDIALLQNDWPDNYR